MAEQNYANGYFDFNDWQNYGITRSDIDDFLLHQQEEIHQQNKLDSDYDDWDDDTVMRIVRDSDGLKIIENETERKNAIVNNRPNVYFPVSIDKTNLMDNEKPLTEICLLNTIKDYDDIIEKVALDKGLDPDLLRAIMYMETTHGYYDKILSILDLQKSILPMNVNVNYWGNSFGTRSELNNPEFNINAGAEMLRRIQNAVRDSNNSIEKTATLYNNLAAKRVSRYGRRVSKIYYEKPWQSPYCLPINLEEWKYRQHQWLMQKIKESIRLR